MKTVKVRNLLLGIVIVSNANNEPDQTVGSPILWGMMVIAIDWVMDRSTLKQLINYVTIVKGPLEPLPFW